MTFARYTGQDDAAKREEILASPPDILLTNYVMLLLLTRVKEQALMVAAAGLRFLVFDELHTYRGRQGADVAFLIRRVRARARVVGASMVPGTSATMTSEGTAAHQRGEVGKVAQLLFGTAEAPTVIGETLELASPLGDATAPAFTGSLRSRVAEGGAPPSGSFEELVADPLVAWVEQTFGVRREAGTNELIRTKPIAAKAAAKQLADATDVGMDDCETRHPGGADGRV